MIDSPINFSHWHTEPALIGGLLFCCWIYALLVGTFRQNLCPRLAYSHKHTFWFSLGMLSFYLAVGSPLDPLGENFLFSAHMIQHNVLMYVSPLFLLLGLPQPLVDRILETNPIFEKILGFFVHPIIAGLLFTLVFSFWHFGVFYEAAIKDKTLHMAEHLSEEVLYETYFYAERIMNLSPLEDQRTGGVLMKLANMAVSVGVLASIFHRWSSRQKA
ncbi:MAG: cytochrome c oxidase assembly protein [Opitutae bacterium]